LYRGKSISQPKLFNFFRCTLVKSSSKTEDKFKGSSPSELSKGCIIAHLPSSSSAPSPSLLPCLSISSLCLFFYAQNSQSAHTAAEENRRDNRSYFWPSCYLDYHRKQHARRTVRYRWTICNRVCSFIQAESFTSF